MVSKNEIVPKIGSIIADIIQQHNYLSENLDEINELELELFMANATFLVDHIAILQRLTQKSNHDIVNRIAEQKNILVNESEELYVSSNQQLSNQQTAEYASGDLSKSSFIFSPEASLGNTQSSNWKDSLADDETHFDFEKKDLDELYDRPLTLAEKQIIGRYETNIELSTLENANTFDEQLKSPDVNMHANYIKEHVKEANLKPSINDMHRAHTSVNKFDKPLAKDLKTMITTNDKLVFVKELFNGYSLAYNEAIQLLNQFNNFEQADSFLQMNYSKNNNWITKKIYVDKFYKIIRERFS